MMTLLELDCDHAATVIAVTAPSPEEQRLHAIGIYVGCTLTKVQQSELSETQPVCISTDTRSLFAISRRLAASIKIRPL